MAGWGSFKTFTTNRHGAPWAEGGSQFLCLILHEEEITVNSLGGFLCHLMIYQDITQRETRFKDSSTA